MCVSTRLASRKRPAVPPPILLPSRSTWPLGRVRCYLVRLHYMLAHIYRADYPAQAAGAQPDYRFADQLCKYTADSRCWSLMSGRRLKRGCFLTSCSDPARKAAAR